MQLHVCIREWADGTFQPVLFSESNVKTLYEHHLAGLEDYDAINPAVVRKKRAKMYELARYVSFVLCPSLGATA